MLRHYLTNHPFIKRFQTFTLLMIVFFMPQNMYASSSGKMKVVNVNFPTIFFFLVVGVLTAVLIYYFIFIRSLRKKNKIDKTANIPDVVQNMIVDAVQNVEASVIVVDVDGKVQYINRAAEEILGYSGIEVLGMSLSNIYDGKSLFIINQLSKETLERIKSGITSNIKTKSGTLQEVINTIVNVRNSYSGLLGTVIFIHPSKILEKIPLSAEPTDSDIAKSSLLESDVDILTCLPSRKCFIDHLNSIHFNKTEPDEKYALMLINLDFFRSINNNLGYEVGDSILKECSERLKSTFSDTCSLARMDGDEFALLMEISSSDDIEATADKIFELMKKPILISSQEIYISVSIGIAYLPDKDKDANEIIGNAAFSVNMVKNTRRGSYRVYSTEISKYNFQKFNLHAELNQALKHEEFILHYQPKIDGKTNHVIGIEALIRWNHPKRGLLFPIDFIPIAEETGVIKYIDEWVLHTACSQLKAWTEEGINDMRLAVNLSAWQFKDQHLVGTVEKVLKETGISPGLLELEITETSAIENLSFTQDILAKLIKMGITISIDDFGTGYSSFNYLKNIPINYLKIDRSFIADIINDNNTCSIVKAIIEVAHALKLKVIAEGVENQEQLNVLNELGCDEIQGYLISKPLSVEDLKKRIHDIDNESHT